MIDYRSLLKKYIGLVSDLEGNGPHGPAPLYVLSVEEQAELVALSEEHNEDMKKQRAGSVKCGQCPHRLIQHYHDTGKCAMGGCRCEGDPK